MHTDNVWTLISTIDDLTSLYKVGNEYCIVKYVYHKWYGLSIEYIRNY